MRISQIPSLPYFCKLFRASKYPYADHVSNARTRKFPSGILYSKDSGAFIQLLMLGFTALIYVQLMFFFTGFFFIGAASRWANGEQEVTQAESSQESPAWNLPDTPAVYKGNYSQETESQNKTQVISLFHILLPVFISEATQKFLRRMKPCVCICVSRIWSLPPQGTLQKFLDDLFQAILSIPPDRPPLAVKYFFDFLEEQADKRGITDPDTLHIWKTNR